jgi:outer membrane lipoprotein-sorting protein
MRRRTLALIVAGAVIAVVLIVGVVTAGAQGPSSLPSITVSQLLQNVATRAQGTTAISGDVAWSNDLLGGGSLLSLGGNQTPAGLSSLLTGGSGRVWAQNGKARLESQGQGGDFVAVFNGATIWTWDSMTSTATQYSPAGGAQGAGAPASLSPAPQASLDPVTAIAALIQKLSPNATLSVTGQSVVAGRQTYTLTLTPTSPVTTFGSVQVAIDGHRWVPLRVQVFAKGDGSAVLSAGFKTVSFSPASSSLFSFTPPSGATIVHKQVGTPATAQGAPVRGTAGKAGADAKGDATGRAPLTLAQAKSKAPFLLIPTSTPAGVAFRGAFVTPTAAKAQTAIGSPTTQQAKMIAVLGKHPTAVLDYGTGFGTVLVVQTKTTTAQDAQLQQQLGQLSMIGKATVNGMPATRLQTELGSVVTFRQGDVRVIVAGFVPWNDLNQIAGSLQ